jgi:GntR family transcriptional repressor for pyruvate dehydrogenase complex
MFQALNPTESVVDKCTHALQEAILQGQIEPGSKLPTERQLALDFGVNRVTVRTALARLLASGLVSVRQGSGYRVRDYRLHGGMDLLGPVIELARSGGQLEEVVADLLIVRRALAAAVLGRLSKGVGPEGLRQISVAIDAFGEAAETGASHKELALADGRILGALLTAAGSPVLGLCLNPILRVLSGLPALSEAMYARPGENLVGWRLFEAWLSAPSSFPLDEIIGQLEKRDLHTLARLRGTR